jgi:methylenetetrahydrofolate dehydrogenase (NADP+)/methenyltetrahydrofolate cyclohydrolase
MNLIDGKAIASELKTELAKKIKNTKTKYKKSPHLVVIIVGNNAESKIYVKNKQIACKEIGIKSTKYELPEKTAQKDLLKKIKELNKDKNVNGILVQLPLPKHINIFEVIKTIDPTKDVDGFHLENVGKLVVGQTEGADAGIVPCTAKGCIHLIKSVLGNTLDGWKALVVGRSNIVGRPVSNMLINENCTVKIAHSKTANLKEECLWADIIVCAVGKPKLIKKNMVKKGAVIIDVGITRMKCVNGQCKIVGDVDFDKVKDIAGAITPVPYGVGPMTIAYLMQNTYEVFLKQNGLV